jgi:hypothetical protein
MYLLLLLALAQTPPDSLQFESIYQKPFNDTLTLAVTVGHQWNEHRTELRASLIDRRRPSQSTFVARLRDTYVDHYEVLRTDDSTVVIERNGSYGEAISRCKLFLHPQAKSLLKQIDYAADIGLRAVDDREAAAALRVPADVVQQLERKPWEAKPDSSQLPPELRTHAMPQSSYADFARARPSRVTDGYGRDDTIIEEAPGPYQVIGPRIWFAKSFYDGEGNTGVGSLGYFDTGTSRYGFVPVGGLADWSGSAVLIETDAAFIGLVGNPEGETYSGGLLRYDFKSHTSKTFPIEEVIHQIVRWKDRIYVATRTGAYQIDPDGSMIRFRVEPNIDNRFILLTQTMVPRPSSNK